MSAASLIHRCDNRSLIFSLLMLSSGSCKCRGHQEGANLLCSGGNQAYQGEGGELGQEEQEIN